MALRPSWEGHLRLSLTCPVALYPATSEPDTVRFNLINPATGNRIKIQTLDGGTKGRHLTKARPTMDELKGFRQTCFHPASSRLLRASGPDVRFAVVALASASASSSFGFWTRPAKYRLLPTVARRGGPRWEALLHEISGFAPSVAGSSWI